jgi:hypothetical protein
MGRFLDTLSDLLDCLDNVSLFILRERPVSVSVVSSFVMLFGFLANLNCFPVEAMHIEQERDVVIRIRMCLVDCHAFSKVLKGLVVHLSLEVRQAEVVLELGIVCVD